MNLFRFSINLILIFCSNQVFAQVNIIKIDDKIPEVNLSFEIFNDTFAKLNFGALNGSNYLLGKYCYKNDTLVFSETNDQLVLANEIFYNDLNDINPDSIELEFHLSSFDSGIYQVFDTLDYVVDSYVYQFNPKTMLLYYSLGDHGIKIKRPKNSNFKIEIKHGAEAIDCFEVKLPSEYNKIEMKTNLLQCTLVPYSIGVDFQFSYPETIFVGNKKNYLQIYLLSNEERDNGWFENSHNIRKK